MGGMGPTPESSCGRRFWLDFFLVMVLFLRGQQAGDIPCRCREYNLPGLPRRTRIGAAPGRPQAAGDPRFRYTGLTGREHLMKRNVPPGILLAALWIALSACASAPPTPTPPETATIEATSVPVATQPTSGTTEPVPGPTHEPATIASTETPELVAEANFECSTDSLIVASVNSDSRHGIYQICIGSQQTRLIVQEGSETIPEPWRLMDFDVSDEGNKLAFVVGQGSGMQGKGGAYTVGLPNLAIHKVREEEHLITEVVLSPSGQWMGYIVSKPGYCDFNIMHLATGAVETIVSGEKVAAAGLPTSMRNVEWSPDGTRILYQVAQQIEVGDPTQTFSAYVANIDSGNKDEQFSMVVR
jgi:hypothetical protein